MLKLTSEKRNPGSKLFALLPLMLMLIGFSSVLLLTSLARADSVLYGGNGGHKNFDGTPLSIHDGWLVTIDQTTGAVIPVGHPAGVARLSGIAFAGRNLLYGATLGGGGFPDVPPPPNSSRLVQINPDSGALVLDIGPITEGTGGRGISIADLAIQPGTGVLYGIESRDAAGGLGEPFGNLYTIDRNTAVATLVGSTGVQNDSLAFAPDGTLYMASANVSSGILVDVQLHTVDPATGQILTTVPTLDAQGVPTFYTALTFRATDGVLVGGTGSGNSLLSGDIYTIDPATGAQLAHLSNTGLNFVGDLDFRPNYQVCLLYDPTKARKSGATLPVKLQLCDGSGNNLSSSSLTLHAVSITQTSTSISGAVQDSGNANPDNDFRFDGGGYIFNLNTKGMAAGTYNLNFTVTGDSFVYSTPFQVK
jgi:hypothetical protein